MNKSGGDVGAFIAGVASPTRRRDALTMIDLFRGITGREPELWSGGIVGFGSCHYAYPTGTEGDVPIAAFAARKTSTTVYLLDVEAHREALNALGPHTAGVGCLYVKDLEKVDLGVIEAIVADEWRRITSGEANNENVTFTITG